MVDLINAKVKQTFEEIILKSLAKELKTVNLKKKHSGFVLPRQ